MATADAFLNHARHGQPETKATHITHETIADQVLTITTMIGVMVGSVMGVVVGAAAGTAYPGAAVIIGTVLGTIPSVTLGEYVIVPLCLALATRVEVHETDREHLTPEADGIRRAAHR